MASGGLRLSRQNTALDPVGCCLALEGRLSSESKESLSGALLQASRSGDLRCRSGEQLCNGNVESAATAAPRCLSAQSHQLPADFLDAFQAEIAPEAASTGECRSKRSSGGLLQQDSLVHSGSSATRNAASGNGSVASVGSPPQSRPVFSTALERTSTATLDANGGVDHGAGVQDPCCTCPPYAVKSTCGKRPNMEDTYALCPNICELPMSPMVQEYADKLPHRIAVQFADHCMYVQPPGGTPQQPPSSGNADADHRNSTEQQQQLQQQIERQNSADPVKAVAQQRSLLEHTHAVVEDTSAGFAGTNLIPTALAAVPDAENSVSSVSSGSDSGSVEKLHFFGVYDGHGGIEASQHCAQRLHYHLSKAVADLASSLLESSASGEATSWNPEVRYIPVDTVRVGAGSSGECPLTVSAAAEDSTASESCAASSTATVSASSSGSSDGDREFGRSISNTSTGNSGGGMQEDADSNEGSTEGSDAPGLTSFCGMMEEVLREAFIRTDEEFSNSGLQAGLVGSTAVVALVGTHRVWIANCGDSRAVLSRGGVAVQVTDDHKPEREDEAERVEKAGGQVLYWNGHRVMGVLAMSRAIGDHCLRPYVIPEPEISVFARHARDEILLLASDGLWDVLSNQEATDLALRSIKRAREKGASRKAAARVAATVLTKAAVDRGSRDNITVVIIDLAPPSTADCSSGGKAASPDCMQGTQKQVAQDSVSSPVPVRSGSGIDNAATGRPSSSSGQRGSRPGSGRLSSSSVSNPFAAAAASPFSTAATGSSELPLPSGASGSGSNACDALSAAAAANASAAERGSRGSGSSGRLRSSATGACIQGSSFTAASSKPVVVKATSASSNGGAVPPVGTLVKELDSIDLSASPAPSSSTQLQAMGRMASAPYAAESSSTSSILEEQPTIVEPPLMLNIKRQASSSPFSAFQGAAPFPDGTDQT